MTQRQRDLVRPKIQGQQQMLHQGVSKIRDDESEEKVVFAGRRRLLSSRTEFRAREEWWTLAERERATSSGFKPALAHFPNMAKLPKQSHARRESPSSRNHISPYVRLCVKVRLCICSSFLRALTDSEKVPTRSGEFSDHW